MNWNELFAYDKATGILTWKATRPGPRSPGNEAGHLSHGYKRVSVRGRGYAVHRIAWELVNGPIPDGHEIDHIDGNRANNAIENLRLVTATENARNKALHRNSNVTGVLGVNRHGAGFKVTCLGRYVGWFSDFDAACQARHAATQQRNFHPNHGRRAS